LKKFQTGGGGGGGRRGGGRGKSRVPGDTGNWGGGVKLKGGEFLSTLWNGSLYPYPFDRLSAKISPTASGGKRVPQIHNIGSNRYIERKHGATGPHSIDKWAALLQKRKASTHKCRTCSWGGDTTPMWINPTIGTLHSQKGEAGVTTQHQEVSWERHRGLEVGTKIVGKRRKKHRMAKTK